MDQAYPIAETFVSPQGEGFWTGTLMCFVRLAGCTVGKPYSNEEWVKAGMELTLRAGRTLRLYQEKCTLYDGRTFSCDTNYRKSKKMSIDEIVLAVGDNETVCLTGGEPMMHDIHPLIWRLVMGRKRVHLETSGTIDLTDLGQFQIANKLWIAVSPKYQCLPQSLEQADEIKLLVDDKFDPTCLSREFRIALEDGKIWLQPINDENDIRVDNMQKCLEVQKEFPRVRISSQAHKLWRVR